MTKSSRKPQSQDKDSFVKSTVESSATVIEKIVVPERLINLQNAFENYEYKLTSTNFTKSGNFSNSPDWSQRGFIFEEHHAESFNIDAASKGIKPQDVKAYTGGSYDLPNNHQQTDIRISGREKLRGEFLNKDYQAKVTSSSEGTKDALNNTKYNDVEKLGPSDHTKDSVIETKFRGTEIKSDALTKSEADQLTDKVRDRSGRVEYSKKEEKTKNLQKQNAADAVRNAAIFAMAAKGIQELFEYSQTKDLRLDNIEESLKKILYSGIEGGAKGGIMHVIVKSFGNSAPIIISAAVITDLAKSIYNYYKGEIDSDQLLSENINNAWKATFSVAGSAVGSSLGMAAAGTSIGGYIGLGASIGTIGGSGIIAGPLLGGVIVGVACAYVAGEICKNGTNAGIRKVLESNSKIKKLYQDGSLSECEFYFEMANINSSLTNWKFQWTDLIPGYGFFSDLSEFQSRKNILISLELELKIKLANLKQDEEDIKNLIYQSHQKEMKRIRSNFSKTAEYQYRSFETLLKRELKSIDPKYVLQINAIRGSIYDLKLKQEELNNLSLEHKEKIVKIKSEFLDKIKEMSDMDESFNIINEIVDAIKSKPIELRGPKVKMIDYLEVLNLERHVSIFN